MLPAVILPREAQGDLPSRHRNRLRTITRLFAAVAAVALSTACRDSKTPPVAAGPSMADSADQVLFKVQYVLTTNGIQRGDLTADTAYVLDDQNRYDLRVAHVVFTTETGAPQGTMDGRRGVYNLSTRILEGWGDVVVQLVDGRTLKSPHVTYNQMTHQISSDTSYVLSRGSDSQYGKGFTSDQAFITFKCLGACGGNSSVLLPEK